MKGYTEFIFSVRHNTFQWTTTIVLQQEDKTYNIIERYECLTSILVYQNDSTSKGFTNIFVLIISHVLGLETNFAEAFGIYFKGFLWTIGNTI